MKIYSYKEGKFIKNKTLIEALEIDLDEDRIITVVGGGGKTSTIFELGRELSSLNKKVIITTTTHMKLEEDFILIEEQDDVRKIGEILNNKNLIKIGKREKAHKISSLDYGLLREAIMFSDFTLIEGDGSKNKPLKAPKDNEPVIIDETNLVIGIMGFDGLDKKIKDICHRPELVSKLLEKDMEDNVECEDLVKIAKDKNGLRKNVNCKYKVVVNKVDREGNLKKCQEIAKLCQKVDIDIIFTNYDIEKRNRR